MRKDFIKQGSQLPFVKEPQIPVANHRPNTAVNSAKPRDLHLFGVEPIVPLCVLDGKDLLHLGLIHLRGHVVGDGAKAPPGKIRQT